MYLLFKSVNQSQRGIIEIIGSWMNYTIGYLPDTHISTFDYRSLNPRIISEEVAYSYMFFGAARSFISIRSGTPQNQRLQVLSSTEADGEKGKYELTINDIGNTVTLMQEVMRLILDEYYDKKLINVNATVSELELNSWPQQKNEAELFLQGESNLPLLSSLASTRGISLEEMVDKVTNAIKNYNNLIAEMLTSKQQIEKEIKECKTIIDCNTLMHMRFGVEMPLIQRSEKNINHSAVFNL